jgi:kynurenine aminotransferase
VSELKIPEDYPFPQSLLGRGRDFKCVFPVITEDQCLILIQRASWFIALEIGVSSIPVSEVCVLFICHFQFPYMTQCKFYCEAHAKIGEKYARFGFCKDVDTLKKAAERLQGLKEYM